MASQSDQMTEHRREMTTDALMDNLTVTVTGYWMEPLRVFPTVIVTAPTMVPSKEGQMEVPMESKRGTQTEIPMAIQWDQRMVHPTENSMGALTEPPTETETGY